MPGDYEYDVFVSYQRRTRPGPAGSQRLCRCGQWVHDVFWPLFLDWMEQALPAAKITWDGDIPRDQLDRDEMIRRRAVHSRVLVSVWSRGYLASPWCRSELHTFALREQHLARGGGGRRLIYPVFFQSSDRNRAGLNHDSRVH